MSAGGSTPSRSAPWPVAGEPDWAAPLVVSSYTLGTTVSFEDRVRAASAAGFDGIGLRAENFWAAEEDGLTGVEMAAMAAGAGVPVCEVEYLTGWGTPADRDSAQRHKEQTVFSMARTFGVQHLNTGLLEELPFDDVVAAFAALCDRAEELTVALEFMPYSGVPDLQTAWRVLQEAGRPNSALIVDVWHWARAGMSAADLASVDAGRIVSVQLCDVQQFPMQPLRAESLGHRLPPGAGYGDAAGVVRSLRDHGVTPDLVGVEVISDELVASGVDTAARTVALAAAAVLGEAHSSTQPSGGPG